MGKYDLTISDIETNVNRFLTYVYGSAVSSQKPEIDFIVAGPGAGKSGVEAFLKYQLKEKGERAAVVSSDKIAEFHPKYDEAIEELPEECYRITRQFVRPATPKIFQALRKNRINILNENTFDKGENDIDFVKKFKDSGYKTSINIIATDMFISRLSCYEREALMLECGDSPRGISKETQERMYNSFVNEIQQLENMNLCDEINVYVRGESVNKPKLVYQLGDNKYRNFNEALITERAKQRNEILKNPVEYLSKIETARKSIIKNGLNPILTANSVEGLKELEKDFLKELNKQKSLE
ncbi:MAG: hypothetical protein HFJ40_07345 [Clostridia bacterium]|nr:hypothetical protein [Clostridia bacterium]